MQSQGTRLYRVKAVAEMFDVSVSTIYRAIESGALSALKIGSGKGAVRVPDTAIVAYRKTCEQAAYQAFVVEGASAQETESDSVQSGAEVSGEVA